MKRGDIFSVLDNAPSARLALGTVNRLDVLIAYVIVPGFDNGLEFRANYSGPPPVVGAECVVAIMTETSEAWIISWDGAGARMPTLYGVPKAMRARCKVAQGASTVLQNLLFTEDAVAPLGVAFNDGGYTFRSAGGVLRDGVFVPETGVYHVELAYTALANSQIAVLNLLVNGSTTLPDGSKAKAASPAAAVTGTPYDPSPQIVWTGKLTAGDIISAQHAQTPSPFALSADATTWYIEKRERPL